jgi:hydrogenase maturation protease
LNAIKRLTGRLRPPKNPQLGLEERETSNVGGARQKSAEALIIGVGNELRGDDAVGICVARRLETLHLPNVRVIEHSGEGADLIETWHNVERVYLIDAVSSQGLVGSIYRFDAHQEPLPARYFGVSSHAFGVAEAIEISRSLGQLPQKLVVYGIECRNFNRGDGISPEVGQATESVIRQLLQEIEVF